jgi:D-alanyl-D-alanine carboxypeptidase/Putative Flp pilus-assembly TadE/G-like
MTKRERGQVLPLVALLLAGMGAAVLGIGRLGGAAVERAQARTAADMAALAGAVGGRVEAAALAAANGARLVEFQERGDQAWARVELGQATASARARRSSSGGGAGPGAGGLVPELQAALAQAGELLGRPVPVTSGYRSPAEQAALWARRDVNPYPVAAPGTSQHERGRAVDVPRSFVALLLAVAGRVGLCHPYPESDPVHFELCR